jgi:hypothetical protein
MGVNHPSVEASDLTTAGEVHATHNLAEKEKAGKRCGRGSRDRDRKREEIRRTLEKYTE